MNLSVAANAASGVLFQNVQFDLANEYNPAHLHFPREQQACILLMHQLNFKRMRMLAST
ncbi:hypothetical protein BSUBE1_3897 [Bacillus subtilis E1]|nr:hypothetical protein BSUBE1_3897 [Bacillus subtilis E1]